MIASNSSRGGPLTVSLEVDEEITDEAPKLDQNGRLMPEEIVRRTSSCLNVSNITVGSKDKGGKELQISVSEGSVCSS